MLLIEFVAEKLNVRLGETFFIQIKENSLVTNGRFYLSRDGLFRENDMVYKNEDKLLRMLITEEAKVVKEECLVETNIPVYGSHYWSYSEIREGEVAAHNWYNNFADNCRLKLGIVFATREEALEQKEKKMLEIRKEQSDRILRYRDLKGETL